MSWKIAWTTSAGTTGIFIVMPTRAERHTVLYDCIVRLGDELQPWDVA